MTDKLTAAQLRDLAGVLTPPEMKPAYPRFFIAGMLRDEAARREGAETKPAFDWMAERDGILGRPEPDAPPAAEDLEARTTGPLTAEDVEWVVNDNAELGVKIGRQFFWLYKGTSLIYENGTHDDGRPMLWRPVGKREFGECCHPVNYADPTKWGTVDVNDGREWQPIDAPYASNTAVNLRKDAAEIEALRARVVELERDTVDAALRAWPETGDVGAEPGRLIDELAAERDKAEASVKALEGALSDLRGAASGFADAVGCHKDFANDKRESHPLDLAIKKASATLAAGGGNG